MSGAPPRGMITAVHEEIKGLLTTAGLHTQYGPAHNLPTLTDGTVGHAAVLWPSGGVETYRRATGAPSARQDAVSVVCVGATILDALAVATKVRATLGGYRLTHVGDGGTLQETVATEPTPEPNTDPQRVSVTITYTTITKGIR